MTKKEDFYSTLGLPRDASPEEIRRAYHLGARHLHPDVNVRPGDTELFIDMQKAYEVLSDPEKRAAYDATLPAEQPPALKLNVLFSRAALIKMDEPQLVDVLLELQPLPGFHPETRPPFNICLVIDRSTSMQGERMDTVKATAIKLFRELGPGDWFSIVTFNDRANVLLPSGHWAAKPDVETNIQMIQTGGGTEIYRGLEAGLDEIRRHRSKKQLNHLILLTDGHTYGDDKACLRLAETAAAQGIGISGMGIGTEWNDAFLDELAMRTGGSSQYVSRLHDMQDYLDQIISSLGQVFAEQLTLDLEMEPGVELHYAFRLSPTSAPLQTTSPIRLGDVPKDTTLSVLLEFKVDPIGENQLHVPMASGRITYAIPTQADLFTPIRLRLGRSVSHSATLEAPHPRLVQALSRLTLYRLQERAQTELNSGDVESATRHYQNLATHLFSRGEHELARTVLKEAEKVVGGENPSEEGRKEIKYGTRALLLPDSPAARTDNDEPGGPGI
jgi:Ca-activated chloride channel family protein